MKFVTLFLKTENVHLQKDVGMIPFLLHQYYGYDSSVVSYRNSGDYSYLEREVRGLSLHFLKRKYGILLDGCLYLLRNSKNIDVLNVYHLNLSSFFYLLIFRIFKKKSGIAYLKLDLNPAGLKTAMAGGPVGWIKRCTMRLASVMSVESTQLYGKLREYYADKVFYLPNGFSLPETKYPVKKENIILTVGNLGTAEKATDVLLNAFAASASRHGFVLRLVGSVEESFRGFVEKYFKQYPELKERVIFCGSIREKEILAAEYDRAKIFALPSRSESFGIALTEAASRGCYLITTQGVPAGYDISAQGRFGITTGIDDTDGLAESFVRLWESETDWEWQAEEIRCHTAENFSWEKLAAKLHARLRSVHAAN